MCETPELKTHEEHHARAALMGLAYSPGYGLYFTVNRAMDAVTLEWCTHDEWHERCESVVREFYYDLPER